jgi:RNA polymerase sigma factor (sigma-70 family)
VSRRSSDHPLGFTLTELEDRKCVLQLSAFGLLIYDFSASMGRLGNVRHMPGTTNQPESLLAVSPEFRTTHWSVVLLAGDNATSDATAALEQLCRAYWYPLYAFVRRKGHNPHDAQDLTQAFFERMMEKSFLQSVDRNKGKFRSFLLACLNHFLAKDWRDGHTLKRGGAATFLPLDTAAYDERLAAETLSTQPPEDFYDRQWALTLLDQAMGRVEQEMKEAGKANLFEATKPFLVEPTRDGAYDPVAERLGMTPRAVSMAVSRLRQRYRELVREAVAQTVTTPLELEEELRNLRRLITQ